MKNNFYCFKIFKKAIYQKCFEILQRIFKGLKTFKLYLYLKTYKLQGKLC